MKHKNRNKIRKHLERKYKTKGEIEARMVSKGGEEFVAEKIRKQIT